VIDVSPLICSGLMYKGVPHRDADLRELHPLLRDGQLCQPEVGDLRLPFRVIRMFSGLMSRWTIPASPATANAAANLPHDVIGDQQLRADPYGSGTAAGSAPGVLWAM